MPPGKALQPSLKMKVDELFLCWLSDDATQRLLHEGLLRIQGTRPGADTSGDTEPHRPGPGEAGDTTEHLARPCPEDEEEEEEEEEEDDRHPARPCPEEDEDGHPAWPCPRDAGDISALPWLSPPHRDPGHHRATPRASSPGDVPPPPSRPSCTPGDPSEDASADTATTATARNAPRPPPPRAVQSPQAERPSPSPPAPLPAPPPPADSRRIPAFYFPRGRPEPSLDVDAAIGRVEDAFARFPNHRATAQDMGVVAKACGCPLYWKAPLFLAAGGDRTGSVSVLTFVAMWRKILRTCHDDAAKFLHLLARPGCHYLEQEDFVPFLQDVVDTHPGLVFLKEAPEFHSRYITTVTQRIFYTVNRSWTGRITCPELRRSPFLQDVALLEHEADINRLTAFFSYEHFYVIYCKFWELDTDHDLLLDARDLARHDDHAISERMVARVLSGAVTRGRQGPRDGRMSYADFVWFLVSEEDKRTPTSIEYWFRCMDLDGDGALSLFELEFFYEEQRQRLQALAVEPLPFADAACQALDLVRPAEDGRISLRDLKRCALAPVFFDTFFNVHKYLDREQREQAWPPRDGDPGPELSDWTRYAAEEYELLVAEEAAGDAWDGEL